jgi:LPXTG-motif cell wall-anchored protein
MSLYKRVPRLIALAAACMLGVVSAGHEASAGTTHSVTVDVTGNEAAESPRPATLSASAICDDEASGAWHVSWSFSAMRDGNDVLILSSSLPVEVWASGAHLMPAGTMPDFSQWPLAQSSAMSLQHGAASVTETLGFRLLPDGIGQPYNDATISLTIDSPCPAPAETTTTMVSTTDATTPSTSTSVSTSAAAEPVAAAVSTTTVAKTTTTAKKTIVASEAVAALPTTGAATANFAVIALAALFTGVALVAVDRKRRRS